MVEEYDEKTDVLLVRKPEPRTFLLLASTPLFDPGPGTAKSNSSETREQTGELYWDGISSMGSLRMVLTRGRCASSIG